MSARIPIANATYRRIVALRDNPSSRDLGLLGARIVLGWIFIYHGAGTLFGAWHSGGIHAQELYFSSTAHLHPATFFAVVSGITEFFGGIAVGLGICARLAGLALFGDMVIAMITVTWANGIVSGPGGSGYELNLALVGLAVSVALVGPGQFSLDTVIGHLRSGRDSKSPGSGR